MDVWRGRDRPGDGSYSRPERGVGDRALFALDHDDLGEGACLLETSVRENPVGGMRLADVAVGRVDLLQADPDPEGDGDDHEREPAEDRGLAVLCAPATHPGGHVV